MPILNPDEEVSICEQCGEEFYHGRTDAAARFDFCSRRCEDSYWFTAKKELEEAWAPSENPSRARTALA